MHSTYTSSASRGAARILIPVVLFLLAIGSTALAQGSVERVRFKKGATSATVKGKLIGYSVNDYLINAREGQRMRLKVKSTNPNVYFMIYSVDGMETQQIEMREFDDILSTTGDYRVRVFVTRAEARRSLRAEYSLVVKIE